ncbi:hypothetical protein PEC730217_41080 [Pectobacterium carotovorum subsp. carotovorum]|nr:hypothetical protein PEC730217_41080 [Pectobacterium carotovorum subsp. carotovorum]
MDYTVHSITIHYEWIIKSMYCLFFYNKVYIVS